VPAWGRLSGQVKKGLFSADCHEIPVKLRVGSVLYQF
jgi:hypothetical protein